VGIGDIGGRLARLAKAFDMRVIGLRRDPSLGHGAADAVHPMSALKSLLPEADFVALTCPLTPETEKLVDAEALARMKPLAYLVNVARGRVVDETALVEALAARRIAGAALDVTVEEPLAPDSRLWGVEDVLIMPHTAGEPARDGTGKGPLQHATGPAGAKEIVEWDGANDLTKQTALAEKGEVVNGRGDTPNKHAALTGTAPDGKAFPPSEDKTCKNWTSSTQ